MKTCLCSWLLALIGFIVGGTGLARGQTLSGIVHFANDVQSGVNAPFHDVDGVTRLSGGNYLAALYVGAVGSPPHTWQRAGSPQPFLTGANAGYWTPANIILVSYPVGSVVVLQVRFWDSMGGAFTSYEEAEFYGAPIGVSRAIVVVLGGGFPPMPTRLTGLQSAGLVSTITLTRGVPGVVTDSTARANGSQNAMLCEIPVGTNRWFRVASSFAGEALLTTAGSSIDTVMSVFHGSIVSPSALTQIACNDDAVPNSPASKIQFPVEANKLYLVCVGGKQGAAGAIQLHHTLATSLAIHWSQPGWVELSWPADATNFVAERVAEWPSAAVASWTTLTNAPITISNRSIVRLTCEPPNQWYRLRLNSPP